MDRPAPPQDRGSIVWGIMCLLGVATLLPWNVFITETDFFNIRVHVPPTYHAIADGFENAISLIFLFVNFFAVMAFLSLQRHIPLHQQVLLPLGLAFGAMALAAAVAVWTSASGAAVILAMLPTVALMGATTAVLQSGVFGLAGLCPPIYVQATSVGQGVAGFGVSVLSFVTIWWAPSSESGEVRTPADVATAACAYFGVSAAVIAASIAGYCALQRLPFWRYYSRAALMAVAAKADEEEKAEGTPHASAWAGSARHLAAPATGEGNSFGAAAQASELDDLPLLRDSSPSALIPASSSGSGGAVQQVAMAGPKDRAGRSGAEPGWAELRGVLWALRGHAAVLALDFAATIAVFPGVTASICSVANPARVPPCLPHVAGAGRLAGDLWTPLLFLVFNGGDTLGRCLAALGPWHERSPRVGTLLAYALARVALVIGQLLCHVITPRPWRLPNLFRSDAFPVVLILLLGTTNGHLASVASMHMPSLLPLEQRKQCGPVIAFAITFGLAVGSILAVVLMSLLQQS